MHMSVLVSIVFVAVCCINFIHAGDNGVDCDCLCCGPEKNDRCSPHSNLPMCDRNKCLSFCKDNDLYYAVVGNDEMRVLFASPDTPPGLSTTTSTALSPDSTTTPIFIELSSDSSATAPIALSSDSSTTPSMALSSDSTTATPIPPVSELTTTPIPSASDSTTTISTASSPGSSSTTKWTTSHSNSPTTVVSNSSATSTSTTSGPSISSSSTTRPSTNATMRSSANTIQSVFQFSHFILFAFVLTFFCF